MVVHVWLNFAQYENGSKLFVLILPLVLLNLGTPCLYKRLVRVQLTSEDSKWSQSALFAIKYVALYQQPRSTNLTGWKLEMGVVS